MGFRFHRSVRLFPGVRLNFGLRGMSVSAGVPGATFNFGTRRSSVTLGIPGTGLSFRQTLGSDRRTPSLSSPTGHVTGDLPLSLPDVDDSPPGAIKSAGVASLTSPDLEGLKALINEASSQRAALQTDWKAALHSRQKAWKKLRRREQFPLRFFMKGSIPKATMAFEVAEAEAEKVAGALSASEIKVEVDLDEACWAEWARLEAAHKRLAGSIKLWDVTSSVAVDRFRTRSAASQSITRKPVRIRPITDSIIAGSHEGMRIENANGDDLDIFPGLVLIRQKQGTDYALIDLRDLTISAHPQRFIEEEAVPSDAPIVDYAWEKSNKDGSPDQRFKNNRKWPVALYGRIEISTAGGIQEVYDSSNCEAAMEFADALLSFQSAMRRYATSPQPAPPKSPDTSGSDQKTISLPALPGVWPAYEVVLVPLALAGLYLAPKFFVRPSVEPVAVLTPTQTAPPSPAVMVQPVPSVDRTVQTQAPAKPNEMLPRPMVTIGGANLRKEPDRNAPALRVVATGTPVMVVELRGEWMRVGDGKGEPWGWIHSSLLRNTR